MIVGEIFGVKLVVEKDWVEEYLCLVIVMKVVESVDEVIDYIEIYGIKYFEVIILEDE